MKPAAELLQERTERLKKAIALEKTDRPPIILTADAFHANQMGVKLSDFCLHVNVSHETMFKSIQRLGDVDGTNAAFSAAKLFPLQFFTKMKLPGRELPDHTLWQLDEQEMMTVEDYDTILDKGWEAFSQDYLANRLNLPVAAMLAEVAAMPQMIKRFEDAGYLVYSRKQGLTVNEYLSGGRSMAKFMRDLFKMPDKVEAVLDVILAGQVADYRQYVRENKPLVVFISPARGASEFYSPKIWEKFVWKYLQAIVEAIVEEGAFVDIHIDGNWERDLTYFRSLPKAKCIFESDSVTNIYKIKEVLGDHMCIKGDVPAALLTLGTPDEVYNYCTKLINDMGSGFILASGCTVPPNAKLENVKAMIAAATGK
ncbi:uroporphyrinogen decarboxylase family protein [Sporomusa acidovorans]|uniref:Uroporphyrinogen decarboxylase (URO-D) domain-containing protein n=1 Tax=Sporomusa acidovorans (strain ATCC 49682 / DSM 3132 / Mol) TaxID=1123286 RepID=A0ABZ3J8N3_SPOA4|nr:uroporphyrinogen decarboxylase family protein [Sporomusa acidovorans]OZC16656.1 methylcobalamin:coenzyme M methyltransferase [Sporomusa acidovorans DSM 3132]SDE07163.1 Uroporphyrinogen decarboxylase (URO-D) [Sporomusa acidovorans]